MPGSDDGTISFWLKRAAGFFAVLLMLLSSVGTYGAEPQKIKPPWEAPEVEKKAKNPVKVTPEGLQGTHIGENSFFVITLRICRKSLLRGLARIRAGGWFVGIPEICVQWPRRTA
jgi:hypothetical protein